MHRIRGLRKLHRPHLTRCQNAPGWHLLYDSIQGTSEAFAHYRRGDVGGVQVGLALDEDNKQLMMIIYSGLSVATLLVSYATIVFCSIRIYRLLNKHRYISGSFTESAEVSCQRTLVGPTNTSFGLSLCNPLFPSSILFLPMRLLHSLATVKIPHLLAPSFLHLSCRTISHTSSLPGCL